MDRVIRRGDLYYANLPYGVGSEQCGNRPVVVIQNNVGNKYSNTVIIAAITSKLERKHLNPTHCRLQAQHGLTRISYVLLEQIQTIDKSRLEEYIGRLTDKFMRKVDRALRISVGLM